MHVLSASAETQPGGEVRKVCERGGGEQTVQVEKKPAWIIAP